MFRWIMPGALCLGLMGGTTAAQQQFTLDDQDQWSRVAEPDPSTPHGQLARARQALAEGQYERAQTLATEWLERHSLHSAAAEAYLIRGDALNARGDYYQALFDYEYLARSFPASEWFVTALEREFEIAERFLSGTKRKLWGLRIVDATDEGVELLIRVQERLPGSALAEQAGMRLADHYFATHDIPMAVEGYSVFIELYPRSTMISRARRRLIASYLAGYEGPAYDAAGLYEARALLQGLRRIEPTTAEELGAEALISDIDENDALKLLRTARWYLGQENPVAAEVALRRLILRYPQTIAAADAMRLLRKVIPELPEPMRRDVAVYAAMREEAAATAPPTDLPAGHTPPAAPADPTAPGSPAAPAAPDTPGARGEDDATPGPLPNVDSAATSPLPGAEASP